MKKLLVLAGLVAATSAPAMAASVVNGSFEVPGVSGISYADCGTVTCTGGAGFEPNGGAFGYAAAPDGNQILHLQNAGTATLSLTDLIAGQSYFVSFFGAARPNYAVLPVSLAFNGTTIGGFTPTSTAFTAFTGYRFTATGTTGSLSFIGGNGVGDLNTGVDLVTLSAVPEPATWAMMIGGFGMVGGAMRSSRRKSKATLATA